MIVCFIFNQILLCYHMTDQTIYVTTRCAFVDSNLKCCERLTTITHPYCEEHTRLVLGVEVRESSIKEAGLGLWAVRDFPADAYLFNYDGERLTKNDYDARYEQAGIGVYGIAVNKKTVIDARTTSSGVARYICTYQGSGKKKNVQYFSDFGIVEIWTLRAIKAGEELLGDYGKEMTKAMGIGKK